MLNTFLGATSYDLTALMVIIDPPGTAAIFAAMTLGETETSRRRQAARASTIALVVLLGFAVLGTRLLEALGIGLPALRVAGGILLFLAAAEMVTGAPTRGGASTADRAAAGGETERDISVFPLAIPLIAGPGAMTTVIVLRAQAGAHVATEAPRLAGLLAALLVSIGATYALLLAARPVARLLGGTGANVIGRVFGVLLAALAAQITLDGLHQSFGV